MCCAGLGPWHRSDFDDELVSVSTKHGHRQAHGSLVAIKCGARIFHYGHPAIWRQREEVHFARIRRPHEQARELGMARVELREQIRGSRFPRELDEDLRDW